MKPFTYLALGDSYTIAESVPIFDSFPYQLVQSMRAENVVAQAPEIVAKTGWTTGELLAHLESYKLLPTYDIISILIGVNNQYRNLDITIYTKEFEQIVQLAAGKVKAPENLFVLSIPDWGATPFGQKSGRENISEEIDRYNLENRKIASRYNAKYLEITEGTRMAKANSELVADDGLHPSSIEYRRWASLLLPAVKSLKFGN